MSKNKKGLEKSRPLWEHTGSNRGPSACKADALNQLSYAPLLFGSAKIGSRIKLPKKIMFFWQQNFIFFEISAYSIILHHVQFLFSE